MSARLDPMVQIGIGIATTALGILVPATGADGVVVLLPAGAATVLGLSLVALGVRRRATERRTAQEEMEELGVAILDFLASRVAETPSEPVGRIKGYRQRRAHDEDTLDLYREELLPHVRQLLRELLSQHAIGRNEVRSLLGAHDLAGVERVGARLVELSGSVRRRQS